MVPKSEPQLDGPPKKEKEQNADANARGEHQGRPRKGTKEEDKNNLPEGMFCLLAEPASPHDLGWKDPAHALWTKKEEKSGRIDPCVSYGNASAKMATGVELKIYVLG